jgi:dTDP-4-amino-4,6-dideoxygalactose transaminase
MAKHTLGTLNLTAQDLESAKSVIASNWLSPGPKVKELETAFSAFHGQKYGTMVNSGTDALRIGLAALKEQRGWKDGDVVFVPAITFVATVNVVLQLNLTPILVDVSMYDFNMNPANLERLYYQDTNPLKRGKCIIPVHLAGKPCDMTEILKVAKTHDLAVLEDSCETMGVEGIAKGDVTAFSFYVAHILTTGVGGMATTNDPTLAKLLWSYCNHGRREMGAFRFDRLGYSCRPTEFEAALGLNQLPRLKEIIARRSQVASLLHTQLSRFPDLYVNYYPESANMFYPILIREGSPVKKEDLMDHLLKNGIECRDLMPIIDQPCYKGLWNTENGFTVAKSVNERGFYIGCHQGMGDSDVEDIGRVFDAFLGGKQIERLSGVGKA